MHCWLALFPHRRPSFLRRYMIHTDRGRYYVMCSNPYDQDSTRRMELNGVYMASLATSLFATCFFVFLLTRRYVEKMYRAESLKELSMEMSLRP